MATTLQRAKHVKVSLVLRISLSKKAVGLYSTWFSLSSLAAGRLPWVRFLQCHYTAELS